MDVRDVKMIETGMVKLPIAPTSKSTVTTSPSSTWRWLPLVSVTSAFGVFLLALATVAGRFVVPWAELLFWGGLLLLWLPIALRILSSKPARWERIALLLMLGGAFYLLRFLNYPLSFAYTDEPLHWLSTNDLLVTGHLFYTNPLLPISPYYPGLEIVTGAVSSLTGLSIFGAGSVVLGVAGLVLVLSLYLFYEHLSGSAWMAGIATLFYMMNPTLFSDTQFAYESLALPFAMFVLFVVTRRSYMSAEHRRGLTLIVWLGLAAVVITHHLTSYILEAFLLLWTAIFLLFWGVSFLQKRKKKDLVSPRGAMLVGLVLIVLWLVYTSGRVIPYLYPPFEATVQQSLQILARTGTPRQLFHDGSGFVEPLWERGTGFASTALVVVGLPFGLLQVWRRYRANTLVLALAITAIAYPITQMARITPSGTITVARLPVFMFVAVAFILTLAAMQFWLSRTPSWRRSVLFIGTIVVIFIGGWVTGTGPLWYRLPGPYQVAADHRSVEPEGIAAAEWARSHLGPGHRMVSDRDNESLVATYGQQSVVTLQNDKIEVAPIFTSLQFSPDVIMLLRGGRIQYLVVDHRLSTGLPRQGTYFNRGEPGALQHQQAISPTALAKFDHVPNLSLVYDSGDIAVYDVEAITNGSSVPLCVPEPPIIGPFPSLQIATVYIGTIDDVASHQVTEMSLTGIQQQRGSICGFFIGIGGTELFQGNITPDGHIQFTLANNTKKTFLTFDGLLQPDGKLAGSYCHPLAGQCSSHHGMWSLAPLI